MILFARPLVGVVGGDQYAPAVMSLRILAIAFALIWLSNLVDYSLVAINKQGMILRIACVGLVVNITSKLFLIPAFGREGAAWSTVITETAVLAPAILLLARYMGGMPSFWVAWRMLPVALVAGVVVYFLNLPWFGEAAITCFLYLAGIGLMRVISIRDVRQLLRRGDSAGAAPRLTAIDVGAGVGID
jgi:O-antigen/teichoic acid export membrane protein